MRIFEGSVKFGTVLYPILAKYARRVSKSLVRLAQEFHFGVAECAADACMPQNGEAGG